MSGAAGNARPVAIICVVTLLFLPSAHAVKLKEDTAAAFDRYVGVAEQQMADDLRAGRFLVVDDFRPPDGQQVYAQLRRGQIYIEQLHTRQDGNPIQVPGGLTHHWVGLAFIDGATLAQTLAVLQDYDNHKKIYKPDVRQSKLLEHDQNEFRVDIQLYRRSIVTVVLNVTVNVKYTALGAHRAMSKSYSTRIAEVENVGQPNEHELPVGNDHGYLWRLNNYWRVEEKDGGVYIQVESIGLSRTVSVDRRVARQPAHPKHP